MQALIPHLIPVVAFFRRPLGTRGGGSGPRRSLDSMETARVSITGPSLAFVISAWLATVSLGCDGRTTVHPGGAGGAGGGAAVLTGFDGREKRSPQARTAPAACRRTGPSGAGEQATTGSSATEPPRRLRFPLQVVGISSGIAIASGGTWNSGGQGAANSAFNCAVLRDGSVQCWGAVPGTVGFTSLPILMPGIQHAVAVSGGDWHACALSDSGSIQCWGANDMGQLGSGSTTERPGTRRGVEPKQRYRHRRARLDVQLRGLGGRLGRVLG